MLHIGKIINPWPNPESVQSHPFKYVMEHLEYETIHQCEKPSRRQGSSDAQMIPNRSHNVNPLTEGREYLHRYLHMYASGNICIHRKTSIYAIYTNQ